MKKKLNETVIANELKGGSLFFAKRTQKEPSATKSDANDRTTERPNDRTDGEANGRTPEQANQRTPEPVNVRTEERSNKRTGERPNAKPETVEKTNRAIIRHSFQFYQDQLIQLKQLRMQKELQGETCHLSDLVRQALDDFLAKENEFLNK